MVQNMFWYLQQFRKVSWLWQTDRQTDGRAAVINCAVYRPTQKMWADWLLRL